MTFQTRFGSLADFRKGGVEVIDDNPKHYVFSNVFEVASRSKPWERVAVAKNFEYVIEAARAAGESPYWSARHDEFVLCMDGEVEVELHKLDQPARGVEDRDGAHRLDALPPSKRMGRSVLRRGHMALLPKQSAYRLRAAAPAAVVFQTIEGPETIARWAEICQVGENTDGSKAEATASAVPRAPVAAAATLPLQSRFETGDADADTGYRSVRAGGFSFRRDRYFAYISHGEIHHQMPVDAFLRALMRDVAWGFFYGTVNFDDVLGTTNFYGEVEMFLGAKNEAFKRAGRDVTERFASADLMKSFKAILRDWTNEGFDPFAAPLETAAAFGAKRGSNEAAIERQRVSARRMVGLPGDTGLRTDDSGYPVNRMFADVAQDQPRVEVEAGFESDVAAFNLFGYLSRSDVTWNPSVCSVLRDSLFCPTSEEYILPIDHGNDRVEWFIQLSDEIIWDVKDGATGRPRARVTMRAGDVAAMPADIRHRGYSTKRSMLLVWENGSPSIPELIRTGKAPVIPVKF
jgi:Hydroquinone 1,2-dioxygenase large subunit N-terminal